MSDLIKRSDAVTAFCMNCKGQPTPCEHEATCGTVNVLRYVASAERKGEWIDNGDRYFRCSLCGTKDTDKWHWCHGCGHPMKGVEDEEST